MNHGYPSHWPVVTETQFERAMQSFDYARDAWADCIVYLDRTGQQPDDLGYEIGRKPPTYRLHPRIAIALL